jgi:pentatricopeptide repeat protein
MINFNFSHQNLGSIVNPNNNAMVRQMIQNLEGANDAESALSLFRQMNGNIRPDKRMYNLLISRFAEEQNMEKALELFDEMGQQAIAPDTVTYNCLISKYVAQQNMEKASELLDKMKRQAITPDRVTYCLVIRGYITQQNTKKALELLDEMKQTITLDEIANRIINELYGEILL